MPKNYGTGVALPARVSGLRSLVRLGRRELWMRLDRNMVIGAHRDASARPPAGPHGAAGAVSGS